jgi:hypothetical protein
MSERTNEAGSLVRGRGLSDGFEAYRTPSESDYDRLLKSELVVFDTNVFLNLYRYKTDAQGALFSVIVKLGDQLWVPHQVAVEFWRNREKTLLERPISTEKTIDELEGLLAKAKSQISEWGNRVALAGEEVRPLQEKLKASFDDVRGQIKRLADDLLVTDVKEKARDTKRDDILSKLLTVLDGKVGYPLEKDDLEKAKQEGERRIKDKEPPAYKDSKKEISEAIGDYIIWEQIIRESIVRSCDVLFVTGDAKEDWWRKERGEIRGPRLELAAELRGRSGKELYMARPESLLYHARRVLSVDVDQDSLEDIERVDRSLQRQSHGWTKLAAGELMRRLEAQNPVQAEVLRKAAEQGGFIKREKVYSIGEYDESRTLRGFTRPIRRICRELQNEGVLDEGATEVIEVLYESDAWSPAVGFGVPDEIVDLISIDEEKHYDDES